MQDHPEDFAEDLAILNYRRKRITPDPAIVKSMQARACVDIVATTIAAMAIFVALLAVLP